VRRGAPGVGGTDLRLGLHHGGFWSVVEPETDGTYVTYGTYEKPDGRRFLARLGAHADSPIRPHAPTVVPRSWRNRPGRARQTR
jgi:hypothetical protein